MQKFCFANIPRHKPKTEAEKWSSRRTHISQTRPGNKYFLLQIFMFASRARLHFVWYINEHIRFIKSNKFVSCCLFGFLFVFFLCRRRHRQRRCCCSLPLYGWVSSFSPCLMKKFRSKCEMYKWVLRDAAIVVKMRACVRVCVCMSEWCERKSFSFECVIAGEQSIHTHTHWFLQAHQEHKLTRSSGRFVAETWNGCREKKKTKNRFERFYFVVVFAGIVVVVFASFLYFFRLAIWELITSR